MRELQHENLELLIRHLSGGATSFNPGRISDGPRLFRRIGEILRGWFSWMGNFRHHSNCVSVAGSFLYLRGGGLCIDRKIRFLDLLKHTLNRTPFLVINMPDRGNGLKTVTESFRTRLTRIEGINSILVFSSVWEGGEPVVVHLSFTKSGRSAVKNHMVGLDFAKSAFSHAGMKNLIANNVYSQDADEYTILIQSRIEGQVQRVRDLSEAELFSYLTACISPIEKLYKNTLESIKDSDVDFVTDKASEIIHKAPEISSLLSPVFDALRLWDQEKTFTSVLVHGDYKPGNILLNSDNEVVGIIDWEVSREHGTPGYDALNLGVITCARYSGKSVFETLCEFWNGGNDSSCLARFGETVRERFSLSEQDIFYISVLVWLEQLNWVASRNSINRTELGDCVIAPAQQILSRPSAGTFSASLAEDKRSTPQRRDGRSEER